MFKTALQPYEMRIDFHTRIIVHDCTFGNLLASVCLRLDLQPSHPASHLNSLLSVHASILSRPYGLGLIIKARHSYIALCPPRLFFLADIAKGCGPVGPLRSRNGFRQFNVQQFETPLSPRRSPAASACGAKRLQLRSFRPTT